MEKGGAANPTRRSFISRCLTLAISFGISQSLFGPTTTLTDETMPADQKPPAKPLDWEIPDGRFFSQANGFPIGASPLGYAIVDDARAKFWSEFKRLGDADRLGYPVSKRFEYQGFICQATQKVVLQWRPELGRTYFTNVFDDLGQAGKNDWLKSFRSTPPPLPPSFDAGRSWSEIIIARQNLLKSRPKLYARYLEGNDPLELYGLPQSEVADAGNHYVVRLQRAVFQEWKVDVPWARAGEVTVANGGDVAKEAGLFPPKAVLPDPPGSLPPDFFPARYAIEGTAAWYAGQFVGRKTASGSIYDPNDPTVTACNAYPLGSKLRVTSKATGKSAEVWVRDIGPFIYPRVLDLSPAAFRSLGHSEAQGSISVRAELITWPGA